MYWRDIPFDPPTRTLRVFGAGCTILLAAGAIWLQTDHPMAAISLTVLAVAFAIVWPVFPQLLRPVFVAWMIVVFPLNWLVSRLLLAFIFYGMVTPLGLFFRVIGRDYLGRRFRPDQETYWAPKPTNDDADSYLRPF